MMPGTPANTLTDAPYHRTVNESKFSYILLVLLLPFRPRVNAMANQAMGAGVEKCGPNSRLDFLNIGTAVLVPS
jgi:hypothetical protein